MKLVSILMCVAFMQVSAHSYSQEKISLDYDNIHISRLLHVIGKKSEYTFLYKTAILPDEKVAIRVKDASLTTVLDKVLAGTTLSYKLMPNRLIVILPQGTTVADAHVKGRVRDESGQPLIGVNVHIKGTTRGTQTDSKGYFELNVPDNAVLEFSYVGYERKELAVSGTRDYDVVLQPNASGLNEIVVVGYGKQRKINLSGAVDVVSGKELDSRPLTNVSSGLQGLIPNLNITQNNGSPNAAPTFNIRGFTSINGGEPFILVDNVPVTIQELTLVNPADVESVTVLKDAAAAAIYGARASFGVVLITTKTGRSDKLAVSVNANYASRSIGRIPKIITDPLVTMQMKHEAATPLYNLYPDAVRAYAKRRSEDPSLPAVIVDPTNPNKYAYYGTTNWLKELYNDAAPAYSANFNVSKADKKLSFYFSGEYYKQQGMIKYGTDDFSRYGLRAKATYQVTDRIKIGTNSVFTNNVYDRPYFLSGDFFHNVNRTPSLSVPYNPDGSFTQDGAALIGVIRDGGRTNSNLNDYLTTLNADISLVKDVWDLKGDVTFRRTSSTLKSFGLPVPYTTGPGQAISYAGYNPSFSSNNNRIMRYNVYNVYTDFHKTFREKHYLQVLAGFNQEYRYEDTMAIDRKNLISNTLPTPQLATGNISQTEKATEWAVRGLFYRVNYIYNDKYIAEFNGRYDGTSRFPAKDRWGFFPSASVGWVASKESFFKPVSRALGMDLFKLRASYGSLGNQASSFAYGYIPQLPSRQINVILDGGLPVSVENPMPVSNSLTWENIRSINGGVDVSFFKDRLNISYDRYVRYTDKMLAPVKALPAVFGAPAPRQNAADLKTKGWELSVSWNDHVKVAGDELRYGVRLALADFRTFITRYDNPAKLLKDVNEGKAFYPGQEIGEIWGLETEGFFQSQDEITKHADQTAVGSDDQGYKFYVGDLKFKDLNGDGKVDYGKNTVDNPGDRRVIGNSQARLPYSVDLNLDWKGFDLRMFFQGIGKRDWYPNPGNHYFWGIYAQPWTNVQVQNMDHWTPENRDAYYPRVKSYIAEDASELGAPQTRYLQNAAYLRLKNITLGYRLPSSLLKRMHVSNLRVYFSAENVFTVSKLKANIDPEGLSGSVYPFQRTYSGGINLSF
ncbi:SusC/RagA family TonB-linked outer membrane protein [Chitinophaga pendula]|uniref:SusC/RagA family TonB-linked outer membrane protein n=1 Tax=Chitinophaga TaxID=79328 RepID=UPI0018DFD293|nr:MULTISPECIES: SusC/RagA family TonB-linked outer membrane protein [Chitinophaga]UCJ08123.1 SusC/RagA family TonB-linked outer membrane protein [Chitinophaga pendula]